MNNSDVDKAMIIWFRQKSVLPDMRLDGTILLTQGNKFRLQIDPEDKTEITALWIERFKQR